MITFIRFMLCAASAVGAIFAFFVWSDSPQYRRWDTEGLITLAFLGGLAVNAVYLTFVGPLVAQRPLAWPFRVFRIISLWLELKERELDTKARTSRQAESK
jgi:hypothetical protein